MVAPIARRRWSPARPSPHETGALLTLDEGVHCGDAIRGRTPDGEGTSVAFRGEPLVEAELHDACGMPLAQLARGPEEPKDGLQLRGGELREFGGAFSG